MTRRSARTRGVIALTCAIGLAWSGSAVAATFEVTGTGDPVPDRCKKSDCSLREAVRAANATANADRIVLGTKRYKLAQDGDDDTALAGDLDVQQGGSKLTIVGKGRKTTIDGSGVDRVFDLDSARLDLDSLTVRGGMTNLDGGGVRATAESSLGLDRVTFQRNEGASGGAVFAQDQSEVRIADSTLDRNSGLSSGGAIFAQGDAEIEIEDSTLSGNRLQSLGGGGAIAARDTAEISIENSTFSGNNGFVGGAIEARDTATFEITFTTVTDSTSASAAIHDSTSSGTPADPRFELRGLIVAGNGDTDNCEFPDSNHVVSNGANVEDANTCRFNAGTDQVDASAGLDGLAKNGGLTKTHALKPSSDAVGGAGSGRCPPRDQRGVKRPQGSGCDSGAYERER